MKFGLTDDEYSYISKTLVEPLKERGVEVWCFGSRARGDYNKFSDLDLLLISKNDNRRIVGELTENLENGNFPYKVDIVSETELADSYRTSVEKDKVLF